MREKSPLDWKPLGEQLRGEGRCLAVRHGDKVGIRRSCFFKGHLEGGRPLGAKKENELAAGGSGGESGGGSDGERTGRGHSFSAGE